MENDVVVLMSTYNGEKYIKEQIDSIFAQTYQGRITILIRDDGSSDATKETVQALAKSDLRDVVFIEGENCGPQKSFLNLIQSAPEASWYFFADQDDVWDDDKIEIAVNAMQTEGDVPAVYCSNYRLTDTNLKVYSEKAIPAKPRFTPLSIIFYNQIPGCTMGFNLKLMSLLKRLELDDIIMHDSMVLSFAAMCGKIFFDDESRIFHRIHAQNVVGDGHKKIHVFSWLKEKIHLLRHKESYDLSEMAEQFLLATQDVENIAYQADVVLLRDYKKKRRNTRKMLRHKDSKGKRFDRTTMSVRSKIRFHLF